MKKESLEIEISRLERELARMPAEETPEAVDAPRRSPVLHWAIGLAVAAGFAALLAFVPARTIPEALPEADATFRLMIALAHLPLIGAFLFLRFTRFDRVWSEELPRSPIARESWRQLLGGMTFLCASWLGLYVWMAVVWSGAGFLPAWVHGPAGLAVADLLNLSGSLAFFTLYLVLDKPSVPVTSDPERNRDFRRAISLVAGLCGAVGLLAVLGRLGYLFPWNELGPLCGSFVAAIAMMYFFGQLDYRYMKIKRWMIAPLYLYVAIQVAWTEIATAGSGGWYPNTLLVLALFGKVYLFSVLVVWIRRRTLQKYLDFAAL